MSIRTIAATAVMTASFAGQAFGQMPPAPLGGPAPVPMGAGPYAGPPGPAMIPPGYPPGPDFAPASGGCAPGIPGGPLDEIGNLRGPRAWLGAEYLLFWTKNSPINAPIATTGPASGFAIPGAAGTRVVLGNEDLNFREQHGVRIMAGYWLTDSFSVEASAFLLPTKNNTLGPVDGGAATLARPFFDANLRNAPNVRLISRPGAFTGSVTVDSTTSLWGAEIYGSLRAIEYGRLTVDGLLGFKHMNLEESIDINDSSRTVGSGVVNFNGSAFRNGATSFVNDHFGTANRIYAVVMGGRYNLHLDAFTLSFIGKLSLGSNEQSMNIDGSTTVTGAGVAPVKVGGGLLAAGPTSGQFHRSDFVTIPEMNLNLNCQVTSHLTLSFGYNVFWINNVVRPGDQMNLPVNQVFVPTSSNFGGRFSTIPTREFNTSEFWAHGLNLGMSVVY